MLDSHLSDEQLLLAADGELSAKELADVSVHLAQCWSCRCRKQDMENAVAAFVHLHRGALDPLLPPPAGPRALLKAQMAQLSTAPVSWSSRWSVGAAQRVAVAAASFALALAGFWFLPAKPVTSVPVSFPEPNLTPGAVVALNRDQICRAPQPKNRTVPVALQRRVFEEYGIPRAEPRAYEIDYLITPALGGADDIRNLWPQSYSSAEWNARVKDELEDRLRDLVCEGRLDLADAQHDLATDWIAAYRKYFHTDKPVEMHP